MTTGNSQCVLVGARTDVRVPPRALENQRFSYTLGQRSKQVTQDIYRCDRPHDQVRTKVCYKGRCANEQNGGIDMGSALHDKLQYLRSVTKPFGDGSSPFLGITARAATPIEGEYRLVRKAEYLKTSGYGNEIGGYLALTDTDRNGRWDGIAITRRFRGKYCEFKPTASSPYSEQGLRSVEYLSHSGKCEAIYLIIEPEAAWKLRVCKSNGVAEDACVSAAERAVVRSVEDAIARFLHGLEKPYAESCGQ